VGRTVEVQPRSIDEAVRALGHDFDNVLITEIVGISRSLHNLLSRKTPVRTIADLSRFGGLALWKTRGFGLARAVDLIDVVTRLPDMNALPRLLPGMETLPVPAWHKFPRPDDDRTGPLATTTLRKAIEAAILSCHNGRRRLAIVSLRLGLEGQPAKLGDVGLTFGLTLERVRQVCSKTYQLLSQLPVSQALLATISGVLEERGCVTLEELGELRPWLADGIPTAVLHALIEELYPELMCGIRFAQTFQV
jgi:hypothetical protein